MNTRLIAKLYFYYFWAVLFCFIPEYALAQRERNYIYLMDCTRSMVGYGDNVNIWSDAKKWLQNDISKQAAGTEITIVPFQDQNYATIHFYGKEFDWASVEKSLDKYVEKITNTNICSAWDLGCNFINPNKDNYLILLTDGIDNVKGVDELRKRLATWCGKYRNAHAFYVMLTKKAIEPRLQEIIDNCPEEHLVNLSDNIVPFGAFDNDITIYTNTLRLPSRHNDITFSAAGTYPATAIQRDENFEVKIYGNNIHDGLVPVEVTAKKSLEELNTTLPDTYVFTFDVKAQGVQIINPTVKVVVTNKPERCLTILPAAGEEKEIGSASWYPGFLFWGEKEKDTIQVNLEDLFNEEAIKDQSAVELTIQDADGNNDFDLFLNNQPAQNGKVRLDAPSKNNQLSLVFHNSAEQGKRYLHVTATGCHELDRINDKPVQEFDLTLRSKYTERMNPLLVILLWLLAAIVAALITWFLILKRMFFPPIKVGSILISDPYYTSMKVKGARRVIFASKRVNQSALNEIFTGKIICNVNPIWQVPLTLEANKKDLRVLRNKTYVFDPYGSVLKRHSEYKIDNTETGEKIRMSIN